MTKSVWQSRITVSFLGSSHPQLGRLFGLLAAQRHQLLLVEAHHGHWRSETTQQKDTFTWTDSFCTNERFPNETRRSQHSPAQTECSLISSLGESSTLMVGNLTKYVFFFSNTVFLDLDKKAPVWESNEKDKLNEQ